MSRAAPLFFADTLRSDFEKLFYLRIPVLPIMCAGQLSKFMRHFLLQKQRDKIPVVLKKKILRAAVEVDEWKLAYIIRRRSANDVEQIIRLSQFSAGRPEDSIDGPTDRAGDIPFCRRRCCRGQQSF
jgi:hypothetical protein